MSMHEWGNWIFAFDQGLFLVRDCHWLFLYACGIVGGLPTCDVRVVWEEGWMGRRTQRW